MTIRPLDEQALRVRKHFLRNYFIVCGTHFEVHGAPSVYASSPCVSCEMVQQQNRTLFVFWTEEYYGKKRVK